MKSPEFKNDQDFIEWFVERAVRYNGYNVEVSTPNQISQETINEIYKQLWNKYHINDLLLTSFECETCKSYNETTPFHLDTSWLLDLTDEDTLKNLNKNVWSKEKINEYLRDWNKIQSVLKEITPQTNALNTRRAYSLFAIIDRVDQGLESLNSIKVIKEHYQNLLDNGTPNMIDHLKGVKVTIVDKLEKDREYELFDA